MSRTLKWVLGILAVLVVLALVAGGVWFWQNRGLMMANVRPYAAQPVPQGTPGVPNGQTPFGPRGFNDDGRNQSRGYGFRMPMMGGRGRFPGFGFGPFGMGMFFIGGLFRLILPLAVLAIVAIIFYQLGRRSGLSHPTVVQREIPPAEAPKTG
jgi:hypothetical protein